MKYDETIVVEGLRRGDQKAYTAMVQRFKHSMFILINGFVYNRHDTLDLMTHSFEDAFLKISYYNPTSKFSTWLFSIAKNNCIDFLRTRHFVVGEVEVSKLCEHIRCGGCTPEEAFIHNQQAEMVHRLVNRLREKPKKYVTEYYFEQLKYSEISEKHQISETTVRVHIHRARNKMLELLTK